MRSRARTRTASMSMRSSSENETLASIRSSTLTARSALSALGSPTSVRHALCAIDIDRLAIEERNVLGVNGADEPCDLLGRAVAAARKTLLEVIVERALRK